MLSAQHTELVHVLNNTLDAEIPDKVSEQEILQLLEKRVSVLIERNVEEFFQLMYRLDISERKLADVLRSEDAISGIAKLIYDRQLEKIQSRLQHKAGNRGVEEDEELTW